MRPGTTNGPTVTRPSTSRTSRRDSPSPDDVRFTYASQVALNREVAAGLAAPVGVFLYWLAVRLSKEPIYPLKDPKLAATYKNQNL